jgi:hypothetical protein
MNENTVMLSLVIAAAVALAVLILLKRAKRKSARNWPSAAGFLNSTAVSLDSGRGQPGAAAYYAEIRYTYKAQGQPYEGTLRRRFLLKGRADSWIQSYASTRRLVIRFRPDRPQDSMLLEEDQANPDDAGAAEFSSFL